MEYKLEQWCYAISFEKDMAFIHLENKAKFKTTQFTIWCYVETCELYM